MAAKLNLVLGVVLCVFAVGCKSPLPDLSASLPWGDDKEKEPPYQQPVKMTVIWSPAMYSQPGQVPTRGFGGRIYFYNSHDEAIAVDGSLVVYAFDDTSKRNSTQVPTRRFAFSGEQFKQHFSPTQLGASYSIWIPWDPVGSPQADISLLPIFSGNSGGVLNGQQSRNLLPGPETPKTETKYEQKVEGPEFTHAPKPAERELLAQTIALPEGTAARLAASQQAPAVVPASATRGIEMSPGPMTVATAGFVQPTTESRSWGPTIPRHPIRPPTGRLARSGPSTQPAPAWRDLPPTAGLPQMPPPPAIPQYPPPTSPQWGQPSSAQVIYRDATETAP